jgi:LPXTG-motif cell wall-anchored protein
MADTDPAALERDIERTRAELARTVDAIADRVSPKRVAERGVAKVKSNAEHFVASVGELVSGNSHRPAQLGEGEAEPWPDGYPQRTLAPVLIGVGAALAVGAAIILMRRRRRRRR